jgi:hypothetical protein
VETETPAPPPEARLIKAAREAIGLSASKAALQTKGIVSAVYWRDVERGTGGRRGERVKVRGSARVIAHMAHAVGITPERIESDGERPDAAKILREIIRSEPPPAIPARGSDAAELPGDWAENEPRNDLAARLFPRDRLKRLVMRAPGTDADKNEILDVLDRKRAEARGERPRRESGTA